MKNVYIYGAMEFLGFSLTIYLLEKGIQVTSIQDRNEKYYEEKTMEIGRNANFKSITIEECLGDFIYDDLLVISLFDYYLLESTIDYCSVNQNLITLIKSLPKSKVKIIWLLPVQWGLKKTELSNEIIPLHLKRYIKHQLDSDVPYLSIYLPSLYGPWQPEICYFQQLILKQIGEQSEINLSKNEWVKDCIYVKDACHKIMELADSCKEGEFILCNKQKNQWKVGVDTLGNPIVCQDENIAHLEDELLDNMKVVEVKNTHTISEVLEFQRNHTLNLKKKRNLY